MSSADLVDALIEEHIHSPNPEARRLALSMRARLTTLDTISKEAGDVARTMIALEILKAVYGDDFADIAEKPISWSWLVGATPTFRHSNNESRQSCGCANILPRKGTRDWLE